MASVKPIIRRNKPLKDGTFTIYIQLIHDQKSAVIKTDFRVKDNQFKDGVVIKHPSASHINVQIRAKLNEFEQKLIDASTRIPMMSIGDIRDMLTSNGTNGRLDFYAFAEQEGEKDTKIGKSTAKTLKSTMTYLKLQFPDLFFQDITPRWCKDLEYRMLTEQKSLSTISYHMRNIRNLFNRAIDADILDQKFFPFRKYKIPKGKRQTERNLSVEEMKKLLLLEDLPAGQKKARDLFMLSFYLIGINFKDMLSATSKQVVRVRLVFDRAKTSRHYSVKIEQEAKLIIKKYEGTEYLLYFLDSPKAADMQTPRHKDVTDNTNRRLKQIAKKLDVEHLSTYSARYTWASLASEIGISKDVISEALGHSTGSAVTAIYINFNQKKVDEANRKVIDYLLQK
ncbi:MAG: site-specific integrase [Bacteroidales bacterium]|nr:site-specific integrase [Bacteroidales bacterium]